MLEMGIIRENADHNVVEWDDHFWPTAGNDLMPILKKEKPRYGLPVLFGALKISENVGGCCYLLKRVSDCQNLEGRNKCIIQNFDGSGCCKDAVKLTTWK